jgi:hypothetical protein
MRRFLGIALIAQLAHAEPTWVGVDEVDLHTALDVLRPFVTATQEKAAVDQAAAYGLDAVAAPGDVWGLAGCRRFSDAERDAAQQRVDRWAVTKVKAKGFSPGRIDLVTGCWIGDEGVVRVSFWTTRPDELIRGLYNAILRVRGTELAVIEELHGANETSGEMLDLTSAGDLDGDRRLDVVFTRPVLLGGMAMRREVVAIVRGKRFVVGPSLHGGPGMGDCPRAVLVRTGDVRGIAVVPEAEGICAVPVGRDAVEVWRVDRTKLVRAPAIDRRLLDATAAVQKRLYALQPLVCATQCVSVLGRASGCTVTDDALAYALAELKPSRDVVAAIHVVERTKGLCQPVRP